SVPYAAATLPPSRVPVDLSRKAAFQDSTLRNSGRSLQIPSTPSHHRALEPADAARDCGSQPPRPDGPARPYRLAPEEPRCLSRQERRAHGADSAPFHHQTTSSYLFLQSPLKALLIIVS